MTTEVVNGYTDRVLEDILEIGLASFPKHWIYSDAKEYYAEKLREKRNIHIFLNEKGKRCGYMLAIPHNDAVRELEKNDPLMKKSQSMYYIETIRIIPENRGKNGLSLMLRELQKELVQKNIKAISIHARISNNLNEIIRRKLKVVFTRRVEKWAYYNGEEPTEYIEADTAVKNECISGY